MKMTREIQTASLAAVALASLGATGIAEGKRRKIADAEPARCERFSQDTDKSERADSEARIKSEVLDLLPAQG